MNANEVIANRALEIAGFKKGDYKKIHPNNHINLGQSTNDAYPTAVRVAILHSVAPLTDALTELCSALAVKAAEFNSVIKMGRTQLQDAVPMTLGQEFEAFRINLEEEVTRLRDASRVFLEVNLGGTAIGTGINAHRDYRSRALAHLRHISGFALVSSPNLIEATPDTGSFVLFSGILKRLATKLSKICNDLRLLSSGPRCGLGEINLPAMQPGSSIMPGKVNPVIPEVVNQVAFQVIGNDLTITLAAEAGQLQLNVMEPVIVFNLFQSMQMLPRAIKTLTNLCVSGITANVDVCRRYVENSIGLITALNPHIGYENSTRIAKEALASGRSVVDLVLEYELMTAEKLAEVLRPENMLSNGN
jgi:aspartate ammonia-lyase